MLHRRHHGVNLIAWLCVACAPQRLAPEPVPASQGIGMGARTRQQLDVSPARLGLELAQGRPISARLSELPPPRRQLTESRELKQITGRLLGGEVLPGGEALQDKLDQKDDVDRLGVAALTFSELFGDTFHPGICEDPIVRFEAEHDEQDWVIDLAIPFYMQFLNDIEPRLAEPDEGCLEALAERGGDVATVMTEEECGLEVEHGFFPADSDCRVCLGEQSGDYEACVTDGRCEAEAVAWTWIDEPEGPAWFQIADAFVLACAPDWSLLTLLLYEPDPDGELPRAFDHTHWSYMCSPAWDPSIGDANFTCFAGDGGPRLGDGLGQGALGRVRQMFRKGDRDQTFYENRTFYAYELGIGNAFTRWFWLYSDGIGIVSMPSVYPDSNSNGEVDPADENYGFGYGGWGMDPLALRPDGSDPDELDDLQARDWLAGATMKGATTRDGVPIHTYNHNRCEPDAWEGPFDDGTWRCNRMRVPDLGFHNDAWNLWNTSEFIQAYAIPVTTLGSTGMADPDIPGGVVPLLAGTAALADEDWDACTWPHQFKPDRAPLEDTPGDWGGPASLWGDTWRFDKPSELDLRMLLSTNQARGFCGGEVP